MIITWIIIGILVLLSIYLIKSIMNLKIPNKVIAQSENKDKNDFNNNIPHTE